MKKSPLQFSLAAMLLTVAVAAVIAWGIGPKPTWDLLLEPKTVCIAGGFAIIKAALDSKGIDRAVMVGLAVSMGFVAVILEWSPELTIWSNFRPALRGLFVGGGLLAVLIYWILCGRKAAPPP